MGAYVTRIDPKTKLERKYYKADDGKLYNDYTAAAEANMSPQARAQRFLSEKVEQAKGLLGKVRDNTLVPAIDSAIKSGSVPPSVAMFGRYLTGTENPLTVASPSMLQAESDNAQRLSTSYADRKSAYDKSKAEFTELTAQQNEFSKDQQEATRLINSITNSPYDVEAHNMGIGPAQDPAGVQRLIDAQERLDSLSKKWPGINTIETDSSKVSLTNSNLQERLEGAQAGMNKNSNYESFKNADANNYSSDRYNLGMENVLETSLGRYNVRNGVIEDRYDFNSFMKPGDQWNVNTGHTDLESALTYAGGRIAHGLGLIKPGSGYEVRIDTGRR